MIVDLMPTDDQAMIADSVGAFFADRLPVERFRDPANWYGAAEMSAWSGLAELGIFGLGVSAERGGVGYAVAEEVMVASAAGRFLISPTLIATMIAAHLGDAGAYAAGTKRAAFANPLRPFIGANAPVDVHLIDAGGADALLLATPLGAWLVPGSAAPDPSPVIGMDETVGLSRATIAPEAIVAPASDFARGELLLAAYLSGLSRAALDMAVEYAKVREQFGQPIGAFQAIKHACADMALRTKGAFSQTCYAAARAGTGDPEPGEAACALLLAGEAALENSRANIQIHGGMGFTDESPAHHFLKRAQTLVLLGGGKHALQRRILEGVA